MKRIYTISLLMVFTSVTAWSLLAVEKGLRCSDCQRQGPDETVALVLNTVFQAAQSMVTIACSDDPYDPKVLQPHIQLSLQNLASVIITAARSLALLSDSPGGGISPEFAQALVNAIREHRKEVLDMGEMLAGARCGRDDCPHGDRPEREREKY